jgi:hypothetical protein
MKIGDVVTYIGCTKEQINWGSNDNPTGILTEGKKYLISDVEIHSMHTKISLSGIVGKYNSVCFDLVQY